jgi:hypothetical protein
MTSVLNVDTIADKAGTGPVALTKQSAAKAWQNLNGSSFGLRDSFNTSTATDVSTGTYNFSFTNSMSNDDYTIVVSSQNFGTNTNTANNIHQGLAPTTSTVRFQHVENSVAADTSEIAASSHGDLA